MEFEAMMVASSIVTVARLMDNIDKSAFSHGAPAGNERFLVMV
jgi:hypothetical protein